jgi:hypothetical protein
MNKILLLSNLSGCYDFAGAQQSRGSLYAELNGKADPAGSAGR